MSDMGDSDKDTAMMQSYKKQKNATTTRMTGYIVLLEGDW